MPRVSFSNASVRRVAMQIIDFSDHRRREVLSKLDTSTRIAVIERVIELKNKRKIKNGKTSN